MSSFGNRIKTLRELLALSQTEFATTLGVGRQATVSAWETDRTAPERGTLRLMGDLTSKPEETFKWLEKGGPQPQLVRRKAGEQMLTLDAGVIHAPSAPLNCPPMTAECRRKIEVALQSVAEAATKGQSVSAASLVPWVVLLSRLANEKGD